MVDEKIKELTVRNVREKMETTKNKLFDARNYREVFFTAIFANEHPDLCFKTCSDNEGNPFFHSGKHFAIFIKTKDGYYAKIYRKQYYNLFVVEEKTSMPDECAPYLRDNEGNLERLVSLL